MSLWRRSRAVRIIARTVLGLLAVLVIAWLSLYLTTERALRAELQRIRDAGEPTSLAEIVPPQVPDDQNAALVYARFYAPAGVGRDGLSFARPGDGEAIEDFGFADVREAEARRILTRPAVIDALGEIRLASRMPYAVPARASTADGNPPCLEAVERFSHWLLARAMLCVRDDDGEEALEWIAVLLRVAQQLDVDPRSAGTVDGLRAVACRWGWIVLDDIPVAPAAARELMVQTGAPDARKHARGALLVLRAQLLDAFRERGADRDPLLDGVTDPSYFTPGQRFLLGGYDTALMKPIRNADELACLRRIDRALRQADAGVTVAKPRRASGLGLVSRLDRILARWAALYPPVAFVWADDIDSASLAGSRKFAAKVNLFRTALALVAHKYEYGAYPRSLAYLRLPPGCDATRDPFSGGQLKYCLYEGGCAMHSVGRDGIDSGGINSADYYSDDIIWRQVW